MKALTAARAPARWLRIAGGGLRVDRSGPRLSYGHARLPAPGEVAGGGMIKFQRLQERWPHDPMGFDLLYLGSSTPPWDWRVQLRLAALRGAPVLLNQNGVAYPAWAGERTAVTNRPLARMLHAADHVFFQSAFCRRASDRWLGPRTGPAEVLHNAVDTRTFTPAAEPPAGLTLLLGGNQYERYRVTSAIRTLALVAAERSDARLVVTGALSFAGGDLAAGRREADALAAGLDVTDRIEYTGAYRQADAPALLRRASLLLHTKVCDPCPGLVSEALACGLPVVHSATGGTPELVGPDAGIGLPGEESWERIEPPPAAALAEAVLAVAGDLPARRAAARDRAVAALDLEPWLARHAAVFAELLR